MRLRLLAIAILLAGCASSNPSATPRATLAPTATAVPTQEPTATPIPIDQAMLARRFTVLVAGADTSRARREGGLEEWNTDALMVISVSADKSRITVLSLPRDTVDLPMADGSIYHHKVNGIAQRLGMPALQETMATLLGVPIDRYVRVDMDDFAWLVDAVGGIDVEVKARIADAHLHLVLDPGRVHMDGALALAFSRTRADLDYGRARRQGQVMLALARKWLEPGVGGLIGSAWLLGSLQTDIRPEELPTLLEIGRRSATAVVTDTVLQPPRFSLFVGFEPNSTRGWVMIPDVPAIQAYARAALSD